MSFYFNKTLLQAVVALLALIPLSTGAAGVAFGPVFVLDGVPAPRDLDSHFRFLSGIFLVVGLMFYASIPSIERKAVLFRVAASLVFVGGVARLISLLVVGAPSLAHIAGLAMELVVVPALVLWQAKLAKEPRTEAAP